MVERGRRVQRTASARKGARAHAATTGAAQSSRAVAKGPPMAHDDVLDLQQRAGNQAVVSRLVVARQPDPKPPVKAPDPPVKAPEPGPPIAWIAELPEHIQTQIDTFSEKFLGQQTAARQKQLQDQRTANRTTFMHTMKWLFGSFDAAEAHFRDIKPMDNDANWPLWAHVSTRERLQAVKTSLEAQKTPMPQTSVALGLRGDHLHTEGKGPGWYTHATGFAIDWKAYAAPHITDPRLATLFETVTGGKTHFDLKMTGIKRLDLIEKMGQGKATPEETKVFLDQLEKEYKRLLEDSDEFKSDLSATSLAPLKEVETARATVNGAQATLDAAKRRGNKAAITAAANALTAAVAMFEEKKKDATGRLKEIFEPWTKKLDAEIAVIDKIAKDKGVDLDKLTGSYGFEELGKKLALLGRKKVVLERTAKQVLAEVLAIHKEVLALAAKVESARAFLASPGTAKLPAAATGWVTDLDDVKTKAEAVATSLAPLKTMLGTALPGAELEPKPLPAVKAAAITQGGVNALKTAVAKLPARVTAATTKLTPVAKPLTDLIAEITGTTKDAADRKAYRAEKVTALGGGTDKAAKAKGEAAVADLLEQKIKWLRLKGAKDGLLTDAEGFVFKAKDVRNPAITQLLGLMSGTEGGGLFTPDAETGGEKEAKEGKWSGSHGFNLAFMKAMVSNGFDLGVAWAGQSDTMHFELVEGRRRLESAGSRPLVAGATLKAAEDKAAADKKAAAEKSGRGEGGGGEGSRGQGGHAAGQTVSRVAADALG